MNQLCWTLLDRKEYVNKVIGSVRSFVDGIKEMMRDGLAMAVNVYGFHFLVGKARWEVWFDFDGRFDVQAQEHMLITSEPFWIPLNLYPSMYYLVGRVWYGKKMHSLQKTLHHVW